MDRYHLYEEIGKGQCSQVYKGRERKRIEYFAIKKVDKNFMNNVRDCDFSFLCQIFQYIDCQGGSNHARFN